MKGIFVGLLILVLCEFVVGASYSEIETNFVIRDDEVSVDAVDDGLSFWVMYGSYLLVAGIAIVVVVAVVCLNKIWKCKRKHRK